MSVDVHHGDMLAVLPTMAADSFHAAVCDPPYHLTSIVKRFGSATAAPAQHGTDGAYARASRGFMGKTWDGGDIALRPETWAEVLRVLRPGAHLLAFGGTRTFHRMACAIEDAGFELRDTVMWIYGSGFPKSHDVSKGIDRAAGAERKVVGKSARHGGGIRGAGTSYEISPEVPDITAPATPEAAEWSGWGTALKAAWEPIIVARKPLVGTVAANVLQHGCGGINIDACRVPLPDGDSLIDGLAGDYERMDTGAVDSQWGFKRVDRAPGLGRWPANVIHDGSDGVLAAFPDAPGQLAFVGEKHGKRDSVNCYGDYGARPNTEPRIELDKSAARFFYSAKADATDRLASKHPTVKPVDLMRYLCRLVTPPRGVILDPFAGSGTTGMAAMAEGFDAVLIEQEAEYVADIRRRIAHVGGGDTPLFA